MSHQETRGQVHGARGREAREGLLQVTDAGRGSAGRRTESYNSTNGVQYVAVRIAQLRRRRTTSSSTLERGFLHENVYFHYCGSLAPTSRQQRNSARSVLMR
ncbi:hypothetical protein EVAR_17641_1 [Eumeta japonica]|uniref:Uncharacterized protein n=1 Tax=Eumeta variegata TaxID=151549 RepID=A0A4C1USV3_EUMVA|nr:hypothetical protein EVAR_17641_1 [Eumeta japonica]